MVTHPEAVPDVVDDRLDVEMGGIRAHRLALGVDAPLVGLGDRADEAGAVDFPGQLGVEEVGDGGQDVDGLGGPVVPMVGHGGRGRRLDHEGHGHEAGEAVLLRHAPVGADGERRPVIGGEHDQGVVVQALGLEAVEELAEQQVWRAPPGAGGAAGRSRRPSLVVHSLSLSPVLPGFG